MSTNQVPPSGQLLSEDLDMNTTTVNCEPNTNGKSATAQFGNSLHLSDILPGDILLYRPQAPNALQRKISNATRSPYTHAGICIREGTIAESVPWPLLIGVRTNGLKEFLENSLCVGVLRTQCTFGNERKNKLCSFIEEVCKSKRFYNLIAAYNFEKNSKNYFDDQLSIIRENYGKYTTDDEFSKQSFFCSAFVVACYSVVGIIAANAQTAYLPEAFSPAALYRDPTFGWLLGYILPEGGSVPDDDPLLTETTLWSQHSSNQWWS